MQQIMDQDNLVSSASAWSHEHLEQEHKYNNDFKIVLGNLWVSDMKHWEKGIPRLLHFQNHTAWLDEYGD